VLGDKGTDYWWSDDVAPFLTPELLASGRKYRKGTDTMDVWFDSGSSWTLIEEMGLRTAEKPVTDMYLEGSDQHRGWFQSSLLTHISASEGKEARTAPYKELVTHGFVLDQEGQKMSKSLGNGLTPIDIIHGGKVSDLCHCCRLKLTASVSCITGPDETAILRHRRPEIMGCRCRLHS
jgi:isoleucyl-tRNA synthetase